MRQPGNPLYPNERLSAFPLPLTAVCHHPAGGECAWGRRKRHEWRRGVTPAVASRVWITGFFVRFYSLSELRFEAYAVVACWTEE